MMMWKKKKIAISVGVMAVLLLAAVGLAQGYVHTYFVRGTKVNGIDLSGKRIGSLEKTIQNYALEVKQRKSGEDTADTFTETISGNEIGLKLGSNEPLYDIIEKQSIWDIFTGAEQEYELENGLSYDEGALQEKVKQLKCLDADYVTAPVNAKPAGYNKEEKRYGITEEKPGNTLDEAQSIEAVKGAVSKLEESIDLAEEDCYVKPEITSESEEITGIVNRLNKIVDTQITYTFGEDTEVLDGDTIHQWISVDQNENISIDEKKVKEYVAGLRKKYDTIFHNREFKTSYGTTVKVEGGDYGWWMDEEQEGKKLIKLIKKGKQIERTPEYRQKAVTFGDKDYGDTYVEVDLTGQHVFVVKKGKKVLETDCVTGNEARGNGTPQGTYSITYKQRDATLKGETYRTPVDYWMPFNGGIGLHDANWRSRFGGTLYKYSGSHGCVNLPPSAAAKIYGMIEKGTPVICYYSDHIVDKGQKVDQSDDPAVPAMNPKASAKPTPKGSDKKTPEPKKTAKPKKTPKPKKTTKSKKKKSKSKKKKVSVKPTKKPTAKPVSRPTEKPVTQPVQKPTEKPVEPTAPPAEAQPTADTGETAN
ncbi:MAG: L,D-transpeptidase family protein [Lachnospiraceae bacterium]|nr:L,D-transpeptidase family protein [Lachnospiraceae bacterium]